LIGKIVNFRYEILEKCGDGSFFSVYKARDKVLNRLVAVKVLVPQYSQNQSFAERLISEAQMVADLGHPNIAKVLEADSQNGTYFTTVEYVRGINLKDRIRRTAPFAISYAVDIAMAVGEALEHAHRSGVVHGDVRPQNIMTSPDGQVKLTDFGTARALAAFPAIREATMLRSVHYMSPEVIRGEPPTPASDVYSLGVVLYEMTTGSVPYDGPTSAAIAARELQDPVPSPQILNAGVPAILNEIVVKAMQKDPAQRYASVSELLAALARIKEWLRTGQTPAVPVRQTTVVPGKEIVYEPEERPESTWRTLIISLLGVLAVAVVTSMIVIRFLPAGREGLPVPNLVGQTFEQAQQIAERTGLQLQRYDDYNDELPAGQIYAMQPKSGETVPKSRPVIQVWVSKGPKLLIVPSVVGLSADDARKAVIKAGLVPGQTLTEYSSTVPADRVMRQAPEAGQRLEPLKPVDIVVSLGPEPLETPPPAADETPGVGQTTDGTQPTGREFTVSIDVPASSHGPQEVRIVVDDATGETTAYDDIREPGESIVQKVRAFGDDVEIRVYLGDRLAQKTRYSHGRQALDESY